MLVSEEGSDVSGGGGMNVMKMSVDLWMLGH